MITSSEKRNVPLSSIVLDDRFNARTKSPDDEEVTLALARSIQETGLDHDLTVEEDGVNPGTYYVTTGFTRARALFRLAQENAWGKDHLVTVTIIRPTDPRDSYLRNLAENVCRRDLRTADLAKRLYELAEGECLNHWAGGTSTLPKVAVKKLAEDLGKSESFVRELVRAWRKASNKVREAWQKELVATDQVRAWCRYDEKQQNERLRAYLAGEDVSEPANGASSTNGHVAIAEAEDEEDEEPRSDRGKESEPRPPTRAEILAKAEAFAKKLDEGGLKGEAKVVARAKWEALRWAAGETRRLGYT